MDPIRNSESKCDEWIVSNPVPRPITVTIPPTAGNQDHRVQREENGMNDKAGALTAYTTQWTTTGRYVVTEIDGVAIIMADDDDMRMGVE